jgi:hypothetical protein
MNMLLLSVLILELLLRLATNPDLYLVLVLLHVVHVVLCVLPAILHVLLVVVHVLAGHTGLDVALVTSSLVGRGYHSASMLDNQTHKRATSFVLSTLAPPTYQPHPFLSWDLKFLLWASKRTAEVGFWPVSAHPSPPVPAPRSLKRVATYQSCPIAMSYYSQGPKGKPNITDNQMRNSEAYS